MKDVLKRMRCAELSESGQVFMQVGYSESDLGFASSKYKAVVMKIDSDMAYRMLEASTAKVDMEEARDFRISLAHWKAYGQSVKFYAEGELAEGECLLTAIVGTSYEIPIVVVVGIDMPIAERPRRKNSVALMEVKRVSRKEGEEIWCPVKIVEHAIRMGSNRYLVTPVGGLGSQWVTEKRLKDK